MNLLQSAGAQPNKQPRYVPIFIDRAFTGIWTQRNPLHDPSDLSTLKFYGGRPDALLAGSNIELTNRLTLQRRPGLVPFSCATYPTPPDRAFSFSLTDGTIRVIIDTGLSPTFALDAVEEISGVAFYVFATPQPSMAFNAFAGLKVQVTGFDKGSNNGTFTVLQSTSTFIILNNPNAVTDTVSVFAQAITAGAVWWDTQLNCQKVLLFAKSPGAGQSYFVAVAGVLYVGDGVDTWTYTPLNTTGTVFNWGITPPSSPPTLVITESGASAVTWLASTVFSTMGLLVDSNGNVQALQSVTLAGNTGNVGSTGSGQPPWNNTTGTTTTETSGSGIRWQNAGPVGTWKASTLFANQAPIYDPATNCVFSNYNPAGTTGAAEPIFTASPGSFFHDGGVKWGCDGIVGTASGQFSVNVWQPNFQYRHFDDGGAPMMVLEPTLLPSVQPVYLMLDESLGLSTSGSGYNPAWQTIAGLITSDNQIQWVCLGSATWQPNTPYSAWSAGNYNFSVVQDTNSPKNFWVCTVTGISNGSIPFPSPSNYGDHVTDGTATWVCVGPIMTWVANTKWYLPVQGFSPPSSSSPYGGADVKDTNGNVQFVTTSGLSGTIQPVWSNILNSLNATTDNQAKWTMAGAFSSNSLSWTTGFVYAYSFESRLASDFYNTNVPPGLKNPLGPPTGSQTGNISTASPIATITGGNAGAVITISGVGSTDPQVDTIVIWRSADGGSADTMFELTEIPAPAPLNGVAQPWSFNDFLPDTANGIFPGLNPLIPAPIDDENDPPPAGFLPMVYNFQRIWGALGSNVIFSGGPDVITGNPNASFNPADVFPYLAPVIRIVKNSQGLVVFLTDSVEFIGGGPTTLSFYSVTLAPGIGLGNYNGLDVYAGEIYFFSSDSQVKTVNPALTLSNIGFPIGDQLQNMDPSKVYLAVQQSGIDNAIYVADGSTGWWRCNPHQVPGGSSGPEPIWSPFANISGGCKLVQSVEVAPGVKRLLVGGIGVNQIILERNLNVFTDNGTAYDAFFVMGNIMLAHQSQIALLKEIAGDFSGVGFAPSMSYLLDEISGPFVTMPNPVYDPPSIYGTTITPKSYSPRRWYFGATGTLARARHFQIRCDFGVTSVGDELFNLCIVGRLMQEL